MASDVLKDLMKALCSIRIVESPVPKRGMGGAHTPSPRSAALSERREDPGQEAA